LTTRGLFISGIIASFLSLIAYDFVIGAINRTFSASYVLENIIADTFGAAIIGFVLSTVAIAANLCFVHLYGSSAWRRSAAALVAILIGTLLNVAVFFVAEFFYRPVPVKIDIVLDQPVQGTIFYEENSTSDKTKVSGTSTERDKESRPFQLFPRALDQAAVDWTSENLLVQWNSIATTSTFDAAIEFFADCSFGQINNAKSEEANIVRVSDVNDVSVSFDPGLSEFSTIDSTRISGRLAAAFKSPLSFWIDRDPDTKQLKVTQLVDKNSVITIFDDERELAFYLYAPLAGDAEGSRIYSARTLHFIINGKTYLIEAAKPNVSAKNSPSPCRTLAPQGAIQKAQETIAGSESVFGVLIRINKRPTSVYGAGDYELKLFGGTGWITLTGAEADEWRHGESGTVSFISFKGNIVSFDIDDSPTTPHPTDGYFAFGEMTGNLEGPTKIRISGTAKALWKNDARANPTKWERLRWEQRLYILGLTLTALGLILRVVITQIQKDHELQWLSSIRRDRPNAMVF
jgi:hypothetical protein